VATHNKFQELKKDYLKAKKKARNEYDFFNLIEKCILGMDEEDSDKKTISDEEFTENGLEREDMQQIT